MFDVAPTLLSEVGSLTKQLDETLGTAEIQYETSAVAVLPQNEF